MENSMEVLQKTKNRITIWPSNPTPVYISGENSACTPVFIAALFTIAKTWKHPKCPSTEEWIKKMWYIYIYIYIYTHTHTHTHTHTMRYYSAIKKERNNAICSNTDGPRDYHMKWSKSDKDKYHDITYMCNLKKWYKWTSLPNWNRLTNIENKLMVTKGERGGAT